MTTFAAKVIQFNKELSFKEKLPQGIRIMNPFKENKEIIPITKIFYNQFYNDNKTVYQGKNGFYVREIRVSDEAEAQKVYRQSLAKSGDFAVLAKEYSKAPTAASGGVALYVRTESGTPE